MIWLWPPRRNRPQELFVAVMIKVAEPSLRSGIVLRPTLAVNVAPLSPWRAQNFQPFAAGNVQALLSVGT